MISKMLLLVRPALVMALFISPLLAQTARVEGTVRTPAGQPVARVTIQLVNSAATMIIFPNGDRGLAGFTTTTDDSGKFVLEKRFAGQKLSFDCHEGGPQLESASPTYVFDIVMRQSQS